MTSSYLRGSRYTGRLLATQLAMAFVLAAAPLGAQEPPPATARTGWEFAGLPTLNFDADEGLGYGAVVELYDYGDGVVRPYRFTLQPTLLFTSRGRRDATLFVDAPGMVPGWRLDGFLGREEHVATPYYGVGNRTVVDPALEDDPANPYYYRFGRTRWQVAGNAQRPLGGTPLRLLVGAAAAHTEIDVLPFDTGTTLLARELGARAAGDAPGGWSNSVRAGLIRDTRDREVGTRRGSWTELLVQQNTKLLGSDHEYTRWTLTDRRYLPLAERLVFANRVLLQGVEGDAPVWDLFVVQTSFKQQEGLGGSKTLRGIPKNRFVGKGMALWNAELRWRAADVSVRGTPFHLVATAFVDSGRVWEQRIHFVELASELHHGVGGGVRLGMGENFVVALDVGHSRLAAAPFYIGLGYLY